MGLNSTGVRVKCQSKRLNVAGEGLPFTVWKGKATSLQMLQDIPVR